MQCHDSYFNCNEHNFDTLFLQKSQSMMNALNFPRRPKWTQKCSSCKMERYREVCNFYKIVSKKAHSYRLSQHSSKVAHQASSCLQFKDHETTRSISTPTWIGCLSIRWLPSALNLQTPIYTPKWERHYEREVSCARTQHIVTGQGSNQSIHR